MWIHDFKNLMAHKKLCHAMTNIGAINSRHTKTYGVTKNHGLPWKFVTLYCQMACHIITTWKTKSLLITKDNNISLFSKWYYSSNQWYELGCEINVTSHEMLQLLINLIAMWHTTVTSHNHKLLLFIKSCKNQWNFVIT
jgi:hypothetical protein